MNAIFLNDNGSPIHRKSNGEIKLIPPFTVLHIYARSFIKCAFVVFFASFSVKMINENVIGKFRLHITYTVT